MDNNNALIISGEKVRTALKKMRVPFVQGEYDLHTLVAQCLDDAGIPHAHEVKTGSRQRIDFLCGTVGIEVKRGKVSSKKVLQQLERYAASDMIEELILVTECRCDLPHSAGGKPLYTVTLSGLWGIAI